eukprot:gene11139-12311_t
MAAVNTTTLLKLYSCPSLWPLDIPKVHLNTWATLTGILGLITFACNAILIYSLFKTKQLNSITNKFILLMSISDLCTSFFVFPLMVIMIVLKEKDNYRNCPFELAVKYLISVFSYFSFCMLFSVSVDRYIHVTKQNRYNHFMNDFRMKLVVIISIVMSNVMTAIYVFTPPLLSLQLTVHISNMMAVTFVLAVYMRVFCRIRMHIENFKQVISKGMSASSVNKEAEREVSAIKTIRILLGAVLILYFPYNIISPIFVYYEFHKGVTPPLSVSIATYIAYTMVLVNTAANAIIYSFVFASGGFHFSHLTRSFPIALQKPAHLSQIHSLLQDTELILSIKMWKSVWVLFAICFVSLTLAQRKSSRKRPGVGTGSCANVFCGVGRECVEGLSKEPVCDCIERCYEPPKPVCANNNVTYDNECEMNKAACSEGTVLKIVSMGSCKIEMEIEKKLMEEEKRKSPQPVVCLQKDRDSLRFSLLKWIKKIETSSEAAGRKYNDILKDIFFVLDENKDSKLETMEFIKLLEGNDSISEILTTDKHTNPVLRGLCADALISFTDIDADSKLNIDEFSKCLDPECELDEREYNDGDEVPQGCNTCVCACGEWVCTSINCDNSVYKKFDKAEKKGQ